MGGLRRARALPEALSLLEGGWDVPDVPGTDSNWLSLVFLPLVLGEGSSLHLVTKLSRWDSKLAMKSSW